MKKILLLTFALLSIIGFSQQEKPQYFDFGLHYSWLSSTPTGTVSLTFERETTYSEFEFSENDPIFSKRYGFNFGIGSVQGFGFGLVLGYGTFTGDYGNKDFKFKVETFSSLVGFRITKEITEYFSITSGLNYNMYSYETQLNMSQEIQDNFTNLGIRIGINLDDYDYITLPVMFRLYIQNVGFSLGGSFHHGRIDPEIGIVFKIK